MRPIPSVIAVAGLACMAFAIAHGGSVIVPVPAESVMVEAPETAVEAQAVSSEPALPGPDRPGSPVPSDEGTQAAGAVLERVEPRAPLSELALALPPKPAAPGDWKGTVLYQPVIPASAVIEAMGYRIALSGVEGLDPQQTCKAGAGGRDWNCGMRARTAFRAFLRGRAVKCVVPPAPERTLISAACTVGEQDVAAWLVESGWARATAGGPYEQQGAAAEQAGRGIFGTPEPASLPAPPAETAPTEEP